MGRRRKNPEIAPVLTPKRGRGQPTLYTPTLISHILERVTSGQTIEQICRDPDMPSKESVYLWLSKYPDFSDAYASACERQSIAMAGEIVEIADTVEVDKAAIAKADLRIRTRQYLMARRNPKLFGDKVQIQSKVDVTTLYVHDDAAILERYANRIAQRQLPKETT